MEFEMLATERLLLKKLTPEGIRYIYDNYPKDEIKRQLGLITDEDFEKDKKKIDGGYTTHDRTILHFKLILKETGEVIGGCGFHNWYSTHRRAEFGYALFKDEHKRKGYMSEAVSPILEYGFNVLDLNRVEAIIGPQNIASLSLIKKNGFTQEGYLKQHYNYDGEIQDSILFALLKQEYAGMKAGK